MDKIVHFEIPCSDLNRAKKFYSELFGWEIKPYPGDEGEEYLRAIATNSDKDGKSMDKGAINGGLQKKGERASTTTLVIQVKNINEAVEKVKNNGGEIKVEPEEIGGMGMYAQFDDPDGHRMGLFEPKEGM